MIETVLCIYFAFGIVVGAIEALYAEPMPDGLDVKSGIMLTVLLACHIAACIFFWPHMVLLDRQEEDE